MAFDKDHDIPSVFFFGMENILGMSYSKRKAKPMIERVLENGFDAGVHGVDYQKTANIRREHDDFAKLSKTSVFGLRNHYVRFDEDTFEKMDKAGYLFDSTWFNKKKLEICAPYKVGKMWEFPLHIMDGYICVPGALEQGLRDTISVIEQAEESGMPYCTILFHDTGFDQDYDPQLKQWYEKTVEYLEKQGYEFISYRQAIWELEHAQ